MSKQKTIYIGGKVTGLPIELVKQKFSALEEHLAKCVFHVIVNPIKEIEAHNAFRIKDGLPEWTDETHRKQIMGYCLYILSTCDELCLMANWSDSKGAIMERNFALSMGMPIVYLK